MIPTYSLDGRGHQIQTFKIDDISDTSKYMFSSMLITNMKVRNRYHLRQKSYDRITLKKYIFSSKLILVI